MKLNFRGALEEDVLPFWLEHGWDRVHGGIWTALDRQGEVIDTDKAIWFQGRTAWTYATMFRTIRPEESWIQLAKSCLDFLQSKAASPNGKLYFTTTADGQPLRMRRYAYSEAFAAIGFAAYAGATSDSKAQELAIHYAGQYLKLTSISPGDDRYQLPAKVDESTRPSIGMTPWMICIAIAQELRECLGDVIIQDRSCSQWIDHCIDRIQRFFVREDLQAVLECCSPDGQVLDHFDGRLLNPGHAIEAAWFIMREAEYRKDASWASLSLRMLDWSWARGWDTEHGGLKYFCDLYDRPIQEYWHDMKFWWPHCEAIIATLYAMRLSTDPKYRRWYELVVEWSFDHFADSEYGEWYGYLHRDGSVASELKGSIWKGPFHLPRMLYYGHVHDGPS